MKHKFSKTVVGLMSMLTLAAGVLVIVMTMIYRFTGNDTSCYRWFWWPFLGIGLGVTVLSLVGLLGILTTRVLEYFYAFIILACGLFCIGLATTIVVVTTDQGQYQAPGVAYEEYYISGFNDWLSGRLNDSWTSGSNIQQCLIDNNICAGLPNSPGDKSHLTMNLTALQGGCCFPPSSCTLYGPTTNVNCPLYEPNGTSCFTCGSCKGAFAHDLSDQWRKYAWGLYAVAGSLLVASFFTLCAVCARKKDAPLPVEVIDNKPAVAYGQGAYAPPQGNQPAYYQQPPPVAYAPPTGAVVAGAAVGTAAGVAAAEHHDDVDTAPAPYVPGTYSADPGTAYQPGVYAPPTDAAIEIGTYSADPGTAYQPGVYAPPTDAAIKTGEAAV